jgi:hypothetical protein
MDTKAWGPPLWDSLFFIAHGFQLNPHPDRVEQYNDFFQSLAGVLPCKYCRESLTGFLKELDFKQYVRDGRGAMRFVYDLKNKVNQKLVTQELAAAQTQFNDVASRVQRSEAVDVPRELRQISKVFYTKDPPPFEEVVRKYQAHEAKCSAQLKTCRKGVATEVEPTDTLLYSAIGGSGARRKVRKSTKKRRTASRRKSSVRRRR